MQARSAKESKVKNLIIVLVLVIGTFALYRHMSKFQMPGKIGEPALDEHDLTHRVLADYLERDLDWLCNSIGRRSSRFSVRAAQLTEGLEDVLQANGFQLEDQEYTAGTSTHHNTIGVRPGSGQGTILIGTHYDSYGKSPCANASGTGVATLMALARRFRNDSFGPTVIIAFFGTGEEPHVGRDTMGAQVWLDAQGKDGHQVDAAYLVGSFGKFHPGDVGQSSVFPWNISHPKSMDWVGVYGGFMGRDIVKSTLASWGKVTSLPARGFAAPTWFPGIPEGDQIPFQGAGIPAVLISDTGSNRDISLRTQFDVPSSINCREMARRVDALGLMLKDIINASGGTTLADAR